MPAQARAQPGPRQQRVFHIRNRHPQVVGADGRAGGGWGRANAGAGDSTCPGRQAGVRDPGLGTPQREAAPSQATRRKPPWRVSGKSLSGSLGGREAGRPRTSRLATRLRSESSCSETSLNCASATARCAAASSACFCARPGGRWQNPRRQVASATAAGGARREGRAQGASAPLPTLRKINRLPRTNNLIMPRQHGLRAAVHCTAPSTTRRAPS